MPIASPTLDNGSLPAMDHAEFEELDSILDELRTRDDQTPQWEFCEGFMAALICARRPIGPGEFLPVLLFTQGDDEEFDAEQHSHFSDDAQQARFMALWQRRWAEVETALDVEVETLEDEACYHPEVIDVRAIIEDLTPEEQAGVNREDLPSFGQVWALGFMYVVECWPGDWTAPRDREAAGWMDIALQSIIAMTEDDGEPAEVSPLFDDGPLTTSVARLNDFGEAIWAVYDLRKLWKSLGPKVESIRKVAVPGRNDACPCGSGKKYKKCHGAG